MTYKIPVVLTRSKRARYKACIGISNGGSKETYKIIEVEADSDAAAYRQLGKLVAPMDRRQIGCRGAVRLFRPGRTN